MTTTTNQMTEQERHEAHLARLALRGLVKQRVASESQIARYFELTDLLERDANRKETR